MQGSQLGLVSDYWKKEEAIQYILHLFLSQNITAFRNIINFYLYCLYQTMTSLKIFINYFYSKYITEYKLITFKEKN
jgi:hypothetical protein